MGSETYFNEKVTYFKVHSNFFVADSIEALVSPPDLEYMGRGEKRYGIARQLVDRGCHDALISVEGRDGKGIALIERKGEPAKGYMWPLGGFINRGIPIVAQKGVGSLASRIKQESGLDIDMEGMVALGWRRFLWPTTPYQTGEEWPLPKEVEDTPHNRRLWNIFASYIEKELPKGIDDTGLLFFARGEGEVNLDNFHDKFTVVTPKMYTDKFRDSLHSYVRDGMDRAIHLL